MTTLCIDEGNSRVKFALFKDNAIASIGIGIEGLEKLNFKEISGIILSSVLADSSSRHFLQNKSIEFLELNQTLAVPFNIKYQSIQTLGMDRLAAVAGCFAQFPDRHSLVIVLGSCITYNFINNRNEFIGGAISPGFRMRLKAMHHFTSKLPDIDWDTEGEIETIGKSTEQSILSGAILGTCHEICGVIAQYQSQFENLNIITTGGDALFLVSQLKNNIFADPELILKGLNFIYQHNAYSEK